ncbi:hypothetical protein ES288_D07G180700v1 [Gossypium darwinii]|uniref:Uncharacterized protein n=1 Tax=Gossypium darwinii TaxID=34276 RepID=A0A5D2BWW5_GOSDA|nr:hypothetical protein ES288_D07G180700v1 [Gossypium darwinii]
MFLYKMRYMHLMNALAGSNLLKEALWSERCDVKWLPSNADLVKFNVDRSRRDKSGLSGCGGWCFWASLVDSYSIVTMTWITKKETQPWKLWSVFVEIDKFIFFLQNYSFVNALTEANGCADSLTMLG